jgi:hypothetical protein
MVLLLDVLASCYELGDKALVFSQSLTTLDLVEFYLSKLQIKGKEGKYWKQGKDWYRYTFIFDCISFAHNEPYKYCVDLEVPYFFIALLRGFDMCVR